MLELTAKKWMQLSKFVDEAIDERTKTNFVSKSLKFICFLNTKKCLILFEPKTEMLGFEYT